jgi:MFS family permease
MAVLLNELFFPKTDPHTAALLTAFAFCSTYVLRPFGALLFGWIGDNIGRKTTVIITTMMMSISCVIMANLPTYAQIGISAAWIVTGCRIFQGLSSMGEVIGAEIYITEITKPPAQYPAAAFPSVSAALGGTVALGVAVLVTIYEGNWRIAFWIGAGIAVIGSIARTKLRETPEFLAEKNKQKQEEYPKIQWNLKSNKIDKSILLNYFLIYCGWPLVFYLSFFYFNPTLKEMFSYSTEDIITHNFWLSIVLLVTKYFWTHLSYKIHPLKILQMRGLIFIILSCFIPTLCYLSTMPLHIFVLQILLLATPLEAAPAQAILIKSIGVLKRFTATSCIYAISRALVYVITSLCLVYLTEEFGHYGLWIIMIPISTGFLWGVNHFIKLEKSAGNFPFPRKSNKIVVA